MSAKLPSQCIKEIYWLISGLFRYKLIKKNYIFIYFSYDVMDYWWQLVIQSKELILYIIYSNLSYNIHYSIILLLLFLKIKKKCINSITFNKKIKQMKKLLTCSSEIGGGPSFMCEERHLWVVIARVTCSFPPLSYTLIYQFLPSQQILPLLPYFTLSFLYCININTF